MTATTYAWWRDGVGIKAWFWINGKLIGAQRKGGGGVWVNIKT